MLWLLFALIGALSKSLLDLLSKKFMQDRQDEYIVTWARFAFAVPILLLALFFIEIPKIDSTFWLAVLIGTPIEVLAILLYIRSIKISPLSLTIPILGMTPLFLILTSYVALKEIPSVKGLAGIIIIVIGTYILGMNSMQRGFFAPLKALIREKGPLLMLAVAFLYSITSNISKIGMLHSSVMFFLIFYLTTRALLYSAIIFFKSRKNIYQIRKHKAQFLVLGILAVTEPLFVLLAFKYALVTYVMSVKRASILFSVILGFMFFSEMQIKERLLGAAIIVAGIVLITLA